MATILPTISWPRHEPQHLQSSACLADTQEQWPLLHPHPMARLRVMILLFAKQSACPLRAAASPGEFGAYPGGARHSLQATRPQASPGAFRT